MMPDCEYRRCKKVAETKSGFLRKWSTWSVQDANHAQEIWLCKKHFKKINKALKADQYDD